MTRRRLRPDELDLWSQVARSTDPLPDRLKAQPQSHVDPAMDKEDRPASPRRDRDGLPAFALGEKSVPSTQTHVFPQTTADRLHRAPVRMDAKAFQRLKRGKLSPEARIDLHGMTLARAHPALVGFILDAQARGHRLVLVITGKGTREDPFDSMPRRRGVLKTQVPQWLALPPLNAAVLQVSEAHLRHGGAGAYYVYLKRLR
jgi:DNA-nicking Smr family endonuclease